MVERAARAYARAVLDTAIPGLLASPPQPLPFAPSLVVRSFVLERDGGNLLVYGTEAPPAAGGVTRRYLNHWHEAMFAGDLDGTPTFVHERDRERAAARTAIAGTFAERATLDGDFELIPTPGHTPGATAFLWDSGDHRVLFTGDSIYLDEDDWVVALDVGGSDRAAFVASLELVRELDFDVLLPWAATAGRAFHAVVDPAGAKRRIDAILARVRRGESR